MIVVAGDLFRSVKIHAESQVTAVGAIPADIEFSLDGQGLRTAAWLGQQTQVRLFAKVGARELSSLGQALEQRNINAALASSDAAPSGLLARVIDADSPAQRYLSSGASATLSPDDISADVLNDASWLHLSGYLFYEPAPRAAAQALIAEAKRRGIGVSVDPGSAEQLRAVSAGAFIEWTQGVDLVLPNLDETRVLVGATGPFIDFDLLAQHYRHAAVTLGSMGAAYLGNGAREQVAASRVEEVDRAGVGDAFAAGFLSAWVGGADPKAALSQGNSLAQTCLGKAGPLP